MASRNKLEFQDGKAILMSLCDLISKGKTCLSVHETIVESDTKRLNFQEFRSDDQLLGKAYRDIEREISELQLDISEYEEPFYNGYNTDPRTRYLRSILLSCKPSTTLWNALELKYNSLQKYLLVESAEDTLWLSASRHWSYELEDWKRRFSLFEEHLKASLPCWEERYLSDDIKTEKKKSMFSLLQQQHTKLLSITSDDRLIINILSKNPSFINNETFQEIIRLSASSISSTQCEQLIIDFVEDFWKILIDMCKVSFEHNSTVILKNQQKQQLTVFDLVINAIYCLENLCRNHILYLLKTHIDDVTEDQLFNYLRSFCFNLPPQESYATELLEQSWQLLYWCFRCGSALSLNKFINFIHNEFSELPTMFPYDIELMTVIAQLLQRKLISAPSEYIYSDRAVYDNKKKNFEDQVFYDNKLTMRLVELLDEQDEKQIQQTNPIVLLLIACLGKGITYKNLSNVTSIELKEIMPDATAEDYIWYHLNLLNKQNEKTLVSELIRLQSRILKSGPNHFSRLGKEPLAFAKIMALALAPIGSIDWLLQTYPELAIICLYWLIFLSQHSYCGGKETIVGLHLTNLHNFIGATSLANAFETILNRWIEPASAIQLCEMLPYGIRKTVLRSFIDSIKLFLIENESELTRIIGSVSSDGSCRGGLLFKALIAQCTSDYMPNKTDSQTEFERIVASLSDFAISKEAILPAITLSYIICQDRAALKLLLQVLCSSDIFPAFESPTELQKHQQKIIRTFYSVFEKRFEFGELQDLIPTFKKAQIASQVVYVYELFSAKQYDLAWKFIIDNQLFPDTNMLLKWQQSELAGLLPQIIKIAIHCLKYQSKKEITTQPSIDIKDQAYTLLQAIAKLNTINSGIFNQLEQDQLNDLKSLSS